MRRPPFRRLLVEAGVVAADRYGQQIVLAERAADGREGAAAAGKEGIRFGDEAQRRAVGVGVVGQRAADREIVDRRIEQLAERVDIVGAAGKAAGRIDEAAAGSRPDQLEEIAVVGIAVAERDDIVDPLGLGRYAAVSALAASSEAANRRLLIMEIPPRSRVGTHGWHRAVMHGHSAIQVTEMSVVGARARLVD